MPGQGGLHSIAWAPTSTPHGTRQVLRLVLPCPSRNWVFRVPTNSQRRSHYSFALAKVRRLSHHPLAGPSSYPIPHQVLRIDSATLARE